MDSFRSGFKFSRGQGCFSQSAESLGKVKKSVKTFLKLEVNLIGERERELLFSSGCRKNATNYLKRRTIIKLRNLTNSFFFCFWRLKFWSIWFLPRPSATARAWPEGWRPRRRTAAGRWASWGRTSWCWRRPEPPSPWRWRSREPRTRPENVTTGLKAPKCFKKDYQPWFPPKGP